MNLKLFERHAWGGASFVLTAALLALSFVPSPGYAAGSPPEGGPTQCTGTSRLTFSPGLTSTEQSVVVGLSDNLFSCVQLLPLISFSGSSQATASRVLSCNTLFGGGGPDFRTFDWNLAPASSSVFRYQSNSVLQQGNIVVTFNGTIVQGRYTGRSAIATYVLTPLLGGQAVDFATVCNSPEGLSDVRGVITLTIL